MHDNFAGANTSRSLNGVNTDDVDDEYGSSWEAALRWEGDLDELGVALGGGITHVELERDDNNGLDDFDEWNAGVDFDWGAFGLGVIYTENNNGEDTDDDNETWVVGIDYTTGAFKLGASFLNNDTNVDGANNEVDTDRWTGGVVYTYGPGMTFRGSLSYVDHEVEGAADMDTTSVLLGTQINF